MNFGTERTRALLDKLGSPDEKIKTVHIAGTNGKGSTAEFITQILIAAGKKTGTFTSPEVYSYFDQFRIDGRIIDRDLLSDCFKRAYEASSGETSFEIETAGVILAFAAAGCEYAVLECGLGGLNDATNAIKKKEVAVITSISLEHTAILGGTVGEICAHKTGIIKNCPSVINAYQTDEAKKYFLSHGYCLTDAPLITKEGNFIYKGKKYVLSVSGSLQPYNAATAIEAAKLLNIGDNAIFEGIKNTKPCGRLEKFEVCGRTYILDGAHNPAAFVPLKEYLEDAKGGKTIVYGSLSDKDIEGNLKNLAGITDNIIAVKCGGYRAADIERTAEACVKYFKNVSKAESVSDALKEAETQTVIVCGSFTLLKEAKEWIEKRR